MKLVQNVCRGRQILIACVMLAGVASAAEEPDPTLQTDADWIDSRWQQTDIGPFLCATIDLPGRQTYKGIAIKVGERGEGAVCYDTELLRFSAGWSGGFLEMHARRYGLIVAPKPAGPLQFSTEPRPGWALTPDAEDPRPRRYGSLPRGRGRHQALYVSGDRVVLESVVEGVVIRESPWFEKLSGQAVFTRTIEVAPSDKALWLRLCDLPGGTGSARKVAGIWWGRFEGDAGIRAAVKGDGAVLSARGSALFVEVPARGEPVRFVTAVWQDGVTGDEALAEHLAGMPAPPPLSAWMNGGPPRWNQPVTTRGHVGKSTGPFAIDTLALPHDNPWKALLFTSGHDFFENGDIAVSTAHGDVWRVSGVDEALTELRWRRFATGLFQPLGLRVIRDRVYVLGRDQITVLEDLDGDGEADRYLNFNNDAFAAGGGHSYATCLETDPEGNFYFLKCAEGTPHGGTLLKVSADGGRLDVVATGFRNPNGLGVGPNGEVTVADQQGEWVPETRLDLIQPGGFYGYLPMHKQEEAPGQFDGPYCWIPRVLDNSAGGQAWIPPGSWGALSGRMIHLSYGRCTFMAILPDARHPELQGGVVGLPGRFLSGVMRARFNPADQALYLTGMRGWQTAAVADGCLQRVRHTGQPLLLPVGFAVRPDGLDLTFDQPLDRDLAEDLESYGAARWNYRWTSRYGSADYSVAEPQREGRDAMKVTGARLHEDGRTVSIQIPGLEPVMQMQLTYSLETDKGEPLLGDFYFTIHKTD